MSTNQVVLDVALLKRAEETATPQARILKLLSEGQGAQPGLREGLAHGPRAPLPIPRLQRRPEVIRGEAAAHVAEALDALVDQGGRGLPVRHGHAAAEQHLELLGEGVIELRRAAELLLAGDLPSLPDGTDDLRHLPGKEGMSFGTCGGWASLVAQLEKNPPVMQETRFDPWVGKIRWRRAWQPTPAFLPGESNGQRSLARYTHTWCSEESDRTE